MTIVTHSAAAAFDRAADGTLVIACVHDCRSVGVALRVARELARSHEGALASSRTADLLPGDFGPKTFLASYGEVPGVEVNEALNGCDKLRNLTL